ncbi:hypothetical protein MIND_01222800 [Mycena indigotica]|uniref:Major facilitator superfamily (MFS) profile domain-containing protein n=1 Tax=Mycena indigotica TaxID=2126181 RepID=A0A8H6S539_9AGAR|nr:uncharacterized protein MIND_01222800 [Mycena indigotica]KAF7291972.1 hypothetical protein MIND_01222800 [Mycena indigotica]
MLRSESAPSRCRAGDALPWWKRPAGWWLMVIAPLSTLYQAGTASAQVELFSDLVCREVYRPETLAVTTSSLRSSMMTPGPALIPCSADPVVQAAVAKLEIVVLTVTGALTFATASWWGSFSDHFGRTRMLAICALGGLLGPLLLILVAKYSEFLPGGYRFIVLHAVVTGLLGGAASESSATNSYLADISIPEERSRIFSIILGFSLAGIGLGPLLGSLILRSTHDVLLLFYIAAGLKAIQTLIILFLMPESLTHEQMQRTAEQVYATNGFQAVSTGHYSLAQRLSAPAMFVLRPLAILLPETTHSSGERKPAEWNMLLLVVSEGLMLFAGSSLINQFLYALRTFQWDAEYLGYCLSSIGFARAGYLVVILPLVLKSIKNGRTAARTMPSEEQPLLVPPEEPEFEGGSYTDPAAISSRPSPEPTSAYATAFDLSLMRFSIFVFIITFAILPLAPTGALFILFISLGSLGAGLEPAANSLVLELYTRRVSNRAKAESESGKLFAAVGVVQTIFGRILGPVIYGSIYSATVASHPRTIFLVAFVNAVLAFGLLWLVRLPAERPEEETIRA